MLPEQLSNWQQLDLRCSLAGQGCSGLDQKPQFAAAQLSGSPAAAVAAASTGACVDLAATVAYVPPVATRADAMQHTAAWRLGLWRLGPCRW